MGLLTMKQPYGVAPVEDRLGWMGDASCAKPGVSSIWDCMDEDGQIWVCSYCPVVDECRAYSDRLEGYRGPLELVGVFAGESVGDRVSRRRESRNRNKRDDREVTA